VPALEASTLPWPKWLAQASAIWLRQALPTQTNRILRGRCEGWVMEKRRKSKIGDWSAFFHFRFSIFQFRSSIFAA
jgi:hypothetical protein